LTPEENFCEFQKFDVTRTEKEDGGRSRNRTYDLAHVRRADSESNLIELLTELLLGASAGGNADDPEGLQ